METFRICLNDPAADTLLLPLLARARCGERYPGLFRDPEAERIAALMPAEKTESLRRLADADCVLYALRQDMLVWAARRYLRQYPEAVVVNLGCGLDASFSKADNGRCRWVNLDLPEVINLREKLLPCRQREYSLAGNGADVSWMDQMEAGRGLFVVSGGAFYYFQPEQVRNLFRALAERFPGGGICFDCQSSKALRQARKTVRKTGNTGADMHFAVDCAKALFRPWSSRFETIETIRGLPRKYLCPGILPLGIRLLLRSRFESGMLKFVEIRFKREGQE